MSRRKVNVFLILLTSLLTFFSPIIHAMPTRDKISILNRRVPYITRRAIERSVLKRCQGISTNLVLSIIKVESDFKVNAYNKRSRDFGLMQINQWHVKKQKLSIYRLITDVDYNIKYGCEILGWFVDKYSYLGEAIGRYNCGVKPSCIQYQMNRRYVRLVLKHFNRLERL